MREFLKDTCWQLLTTSSIDSLQSSRSDAHTRAETVDSEHNPSFPSILASKITAGVGVGEKQTTFVVQVRMLSIM
jgi:hypothetical protein